MTKDEASRHKAWIIQHAMGTPLQVWSKRDLCWYDSPNPSFRLNCVYRVKPEITPEEKSRQTFEKVIGYNYSTIPYAFNFWEAARKYYQAANNKA